jgi:AcrR family transcriptional regulator
MATICDTKKVLAKSLLQLCEKKTFDKVSVHDIVQNCNAGRQTFYNHFHDKYDLTFWFITYNANLIAEQTHRSNEGWTYFLRTYLRFVNDNIGFFKGLCEHSSHATLSERLVVHFGALYSVFYLPYTSVIDCAFRSGDAGMLSFAARFYCCGLLSIAKTWLRGGAKDAPETLAEQLASVAPALEPV